MNIDVILGIVRHLLTTFGGVLVTKGITDATHLEAAVGGIIAIIGVVWSVVKNKKTADGK
jgi:hypothetical protein